MRILVYNWRDMAHPRAGGAEVYTHNVAKHWVEWGHEVTWFTSAVEGRPSVEEVDGIRIVRRGGRLGVYREARRFYEKEGKGHFDVVLDEINTRPFMAPTFVTGVPVVALLHQVCREVWFHEVPFPLAVVGRYYLEPRWLRRYRGVPVMTVSESSRSSLLRYGLSRVTVVPEGFSVPQEVPRLAKEQVPTVVFIGRLQSNKRPWHAVRAFQLAQREIAGMQMWIIGSGPLESALKRRAGSSVQFFGRVGDARKYELLARCHALLVTSVREGWGLVVTEAASVGTLAVGYDVAGLSDSVRSSGGVLVRPTPRSLSKQLVKTLPHIIAGNGPRPVVSGVVPWPVVGDALLAQLEAAVLSARPHRPGSR